MLAAVNKGGDFIAADSKAKNSVLGQLNSVIEEAAKAIPLFVKNPGRDFSRRRKLDAETFIKAALNMQGNSLNAELLHAFPDKDRRMTASAYEQQKNKILPELFAYILHEFNKTQTHPKRMNGYRIFAADGSDFNTPYSKESPFELVTAKRKSRNKDGSLPKEPKPFCQFHANILYDVTNRTYEDCIIQSRKEYDERAAILKMVRRRKEKSPYIIIMDRGYGGFNLFETLNRTPGCKFVVRTKTGNGTLREIAALPDKEADIDLETTIVTKIRQLRRIENAHMIAVHEGKYKEKLSPNTRYKKWDFESPCRVKYRIVKFRINNEESGKECWEVLVTNLDRFQFPIDKMKELYHMRWDIETSFRELKYALGAVQFHSRKPDFQIMELFAQMIMFNAVSRIIALTAIPDGNRKWKYAIDFKMAVLLTRKHFRLSSHAPPDDLLKEIQMYINPVRPGRSDTRNVKARTAVWFLYRVV